MAPVKYRRILPAPPSSPHLARCFVERRKRGLSSPIRAASLKQRGRDEVALNKAQADNGDRRRSKRSKKGEGADKENEVLDRKPTALPDIVAVVGRKWDEVATGLEQGGFSKREAGGVSVHYRMLKSRAEGLNVPLTGPLPLAAFTLEEDALLVIAQYTNSLAAKTKEEEKKAGRSGIKWSDWQDRFPERGTFDLSTRLGDGSTAEAAALPGRPFPRRDEHPRSTNDSPVASPELIASPQPSRPSSPQPGPSRLSSAFKSKHPEQRDQLCAPPSAFQLHTASSPTLPPSPFAATTRSNPLPFSPSSHLRPPSLPPFSAPELDGSAPLKHVFAHNSGKKRSRESATSVDGERLKKWARRVLAGE
ncbi:hypothetical protein JCM10213v2_008535 [Rhodosporidiobolus nylandii]